MLTTVGDLVEDLVVSGGDLLDEADDGPSGVRRLLLNHAADTAARVVRRQGGSAANVAMAAAASGLPARFIGQVGDDYVGRHLVTTLADRGVDVVIRHSGRTATILVLLHPDGERSMLTDRGCAVELARPDRGWLNGATLLHVPLYSLSEGPLAATSTTLISWAHGEGIPVSIDASATSLLASMGPTAVARLLSELKPAFLLANEDEVRLLSEALGRDALITLADEALVEKRGGRSTRVWGRAGSRFEVPVEPVGPVTDTTGAGDAFAAGFLGAMIAGASLGDGVLSGHRFAADHLVDVNQGP